VRTQLPYAAIIESHDGLQKNTLYETMWRALADSRKRPCCLEVFDGATQRFLFFRDGQIYASAAIGVAGASQYSDSTIREFLLAVDHMHFPQLVWYALDSKILHSILILFQKKPGLCVQTSLVDLDELLDKIEAEGKSCIVSAVRDNFLAVLRYEKGATTALCHGECLPQPREASFREEFLVKIYTITTEKPVTIGLYEDLLVSYSSDARTIPEGFEGSFEELFLSKPPMVSLRFKDRELDHWVFDKPQLKIGRTPDNDIVIDNLAVSRLHAILENDKGSYYVRDCDSLNGTVVNGKKVGRARLNDGDVVSIGKHSIVFRRQGGRALPVEDAIQGFDQTMVIKTGAQPVAPVPRPSPQPVRQPRLVIKTEWGDRIIQIDKDKVTIGRDEEADIAIDGVFVAKLHAEIVRNEDRFIIRHVGGLRKVTVGGKSVREVELSDNDEIKIAKGEFIFQE